MRSSPSYFFLFFLLQSCLSYVFPRSEWQSQSSIDQSSPIPRTAVLGTELSPHKRRELQSRATEGVFWDYSNDPIAGEPMEALDIAIIRVSIEHARTLALAALNVQRDNALYATIFGDPAGEVYDAVMQNIRRVINILDTATPTQLGQITPDDVVEGHTTFYRAQLPGTFGNGEYVTASTWDNNIAFRPEFFDDQTYFSPSVPSWANPMSLAHPAFFELALARTRGAAMFHELIHLVSRGRMQPILDQAVAEGAEINIDFGGDPVRVVDVALNGIRPSPGDNNAISRDGQVTFGIDVTQRAYNVDTIGRMSLMTYGRFMAALNAQHYAVLAFAAFTNTPVATFVPSEVQRAVTPPNTPTEQVSVWTAQISENNTALAAAIRENENRALLKVLLGIEKILPNWFIATHHVEI